MKEMGGVSDMKETSSVLEDDLSMVFGAYNGTNPWL
jgi:hypothetical protein